MPHRSHAQHGTSQFIRARVWPAVWKIALVTFGAFVLAMAAREIMTAPKALAGGYTASGS